MNIINIEKISKNYTERPLFRDASFFVEEGEKVGIVGINGTGKSTLLKIVAGVEEPDQGSVIRARDLVFSFLPQTPEFNEEMTVRENILLKTKEETGVLSFLTRFHFPDPETPVSALSGGQRKQLALAITLSAPSDVLLLDEPTNHLDYGMIEWLQKTLNAYRGTLIMVTHDRYFLDECCSRIVEIDRGNLYSYHTNYSGYLEAKAERLMLEASTEVKRQNILRKELAWIRRGARARTTKQKAHIQRYEELRDREVPEKDREDFTLQSAGVSRMGRTTIEIENLSFGYGEKVLIRDFNYIFDRQDRIGFIGSNGCGKTTLMKLISGELQPDKGSILLGQTIRLSCYKQEMTFPDPSKKVIDFVKDIGEYLPTPEGRVSASTMLERFLFTPDQQYGRIGSLSGGEKKRLMLLSVLMEAPNVLILDEPTNDLDTETLAVLEDYLESFQGIIITVSHDRHFLDRIVRRLFCFEGNGVLKQYEGGYSDYLEKTEVPFFTDRPEDPEKKPRKEVQAEAQNQRKPSEKKLKFTFKEQRDYEMIEGEIEALEEKISALETEMSENGSDFVKLGTLSEEKDRLEEELLLKMERWEELENKAREIAEGRETK